MWRETLHLRVVSAAPGSAAVRSPEPFPGSC